MTTDVRPAARPLALALGVAAFLVAGAALLFGAGTSGGRLLWIGGAAWLLAAAWGAAAALGAVPAPTLGRAGRCALGSLVALALWMGVSIAWSDAPDRSWGSLNRGLAYVALAVVGVLAGAAARRRPGTVAGALALLLGAALGWALLGKVFPGLFPDGARAARLRSPVGYWNALALVGDMALPLGLWLAGGGGAGARAGRARAARLGGAALVYGATIAVLLTTSRGGIAIGALAVLAWLVLDARRFDSLVALACTVPAAAAVAAWGLTSSGLSDDGRNRAAREAAGGWFALALLVGAGVAGALLLAWWRRDSRAPLAEARRQAVGRAGIVALVVALVAAGIVLGVRGGWEKDSQVTQTAGRLGSANTNNRWTWWQEAWNVFTDQPVEGAGAGAFVVSRTPLRTNALDVVEPHNIGVQQLAETGLVGFLLWAGLVAGGVLAVRRAVCRSLPDARRATLALGLVPGCFLLHSLVDISWDFVAVAAPALLALGAVIGAGGGGGQAAAEVVPARRQGGRLAAAGGIALALAAIASLAVPWVASHKVDTAYAALDAGNPARAAALARDARALDPFSPEPYRAWAGAALEAGDVDAAVRIYRRALREQPASGPLRYELGAILAGAGRWREAYTALNDAYTVDPWGPAGRKDGLLDQARAKIEGRG